MSIIYKGQTVANVGGGSGGVTMDQVNAAIQDAVADIQPQDVYSTEETRIGTWINGKPLYQRTWSARSATVGNTWAETGVVIENLDELINYDVIGKSNLSNVFIKLPYFENVDSHVSVNYWNGYEGKYGFFTYCYHVSGPYFYNMPLHITARYTKTTD